MLQWLRNLTWAANTNSWSSNASTKTNSTVSIDSYATWISPKNKSPCPIRNHQCSCTPTNLLTEHWEENQQTVKVKTHLIVKSIVFYIYNFPLPHRWGIIGFPFRNKITFFFYWGGSKIAFRVPRCFTLHRQSTRATESCGQWTPNPQEVVQPFVLRPMVQIVQDVCTFKDDRTQWANQICTIPFIH